LKDEDVPEHVRSSDAFLHAKRKVAEEGLTAQDMVADYIKLLWNYALEMITKARGDDIVNNLRFHVVITVPAIWKGYARQSMREAALKAGILDDRDAGETRLTFVPEPEAAAMDTLVEVKQSTKPGEVYMICDCGGGTVVRGCFIFSLI
jgi:molecular chaperone DnaK (HSP70)